MTTLDFKITAEGVAAQRAMDTFVRKMKDVQGAAAAAGQTGAQSAEQLQTAFDRLNTRVATLPTQFRQVGQSIGAANGQISNMTAQFNDIGVMLAAGQNPLMLAIQQGTQISQIFGGQGLGSVLTTLKASFLSLLSPVSLLTIGLIAGGATLVQWAASAASAAFGTVDLAEKVKTLEEATKAYSDAAELAQEPIEKLRIKYGELADEVLRARQEIAQQAFASARGALNEVSTATGFAVPGVENRAAQMRELEELRARAEAAYARLNAGGDAGLDLSQANASIMALQGSIRALDQDLNAVAASYGLTVEEAERLAVAANTLNAAEGVAAQAEAASNLSAVMIEVFGSTEAANAATGNMLDSLRAVVLQGAELTRAMEGSAGETERTTAAMVETNAQAREMAAQIFEALGGQEALTAAASGLSGYFAAAQSSLGGLVAKLWEGAQAASSMMRAQAAAEYIKDNQRGGTAYLANQYAQYGMGRAAGEAAVRESSYSIPPAPRSSSGVGGGSAPRDDFGALVKQAEAAMSKLDIAIATVNEKVKAGLLTTAGGVDAISTAKKQAADQLSSLIPQIDAVSEAAGPRAAGQVDKWREALRGLAGDIKEVSTDMSKSFSSSFSNAFADFITGSASAGDAFEDFGKTVLNQLAKMAADKFTASFITPLFDSLIGGLFPSANGNVFAGGGVVPFARGGVPLSRYRNSIVSRPTTFPMAGLMGEAGPEAIMPLANGGVLGRIGGVETRFPLRRGAGGVLGVDVGNPFDAMLAGMSRGVSGSSAGPSKTVVNISTPQGTKAEVTERNEGGQKVMDVMIREIEGRMAAGLSRGVGPLADVLGGNYGVRRQAGGA